MSRASISVGLVRGLVLESAAMGCLFGDYIVYLAPKAMRFSVHMYFIAQGFVT